MCDLKEFRKEENTFFRLELEVAARVEAPETEEQDFEENDCRSVGDIRPLAALLNEPAFSSSESPQPSGEFFEARNSRISS